MQIRFHTHGFVIYLCFYFHLAERQNREDFVISLFVYDAHDERKKLEEILSICRIKEWRTKKWSNKIVYISKEKIYFLFFVAKERKYYAIISKSRKKMKANEEANSFGFFAT